MDTFRRFLIGLWLVLGLCATAQAVTYQATVTFTAAGQTDSTEWGACTKACNVVYGGKTCASAGYGFFACTGGGGQGLVASTTCPYGGTVSGSNCINATSCPPGTVNNAGTCQGTPGCPSAGTSTFACTPYTNNVGVANVVISGCGFTLAQGGKASNGYGTGGVTQFCGQYTATGSTATASPPTTPSGSPTCDPSSSVPCASQSAPGSGAAWSNAPAPKQCGGGNCYGQVNGQDVCVPCGATTPQTTVKSNASSGSVVLPGQSTPSATTNNSTTTTTCVNGVCTTSSTVNITVSGGGSGGTGTQTGTGTGSGGGGAGTGTNGTTTGSGSESQSKDDFCAKNPKADQCKGAESSFGGSCGAVPTCTGDAVQCATAQAVFQTNCALSPQANAHSDLGNAAMAGTDGVAQSATAVSSFAVTMAPVTRTLSGACPAPVSFSLMGRSAQFDVSAMCPWLETLGNILVGLAWISAFWIISRSVN